MANTAPSPGLTSRELPVTEKEPLLAGVVSGRRFAVAEVDGLDRNRWTIWIGISGRVQPEWVDDLGRNGWTISPGIVIPYPSDRLGVSPGPPVDLGHAHTGLAHVSDVQLFLTPHQSWHLRPRSHRCRIRGVGISFRCFRGFLSRCYRGVYSRWLHSRTTASFR